MTLQEEIEKLVGPAPQAPSQARFLGFNFNQAAELDYDRKRQLYDRAMQEAAHALAPQYFNPLRNASLGEVSRLGGHDPASIATPDQYRDVQREEPSLVPKAAMHFTREGSMPMGSVLTPMAAQYQGPGEPRETGTGEAISQMIRSATLGDSDAALKAYAERRPGVFSEGPRRPYTELVSTPVQLQGPPNPAGPEIYMRQGDPLQVTSRELNLDAPATLSQQMMGMSDIKREATWPRNMGGSSTLNWKLGAVKQLVDNGVEEADAVRNVFGGEPLPGGAKANNLDARTDTSRARGTNLNANTALTKKRVDNYDQEANDKHQDVQSRITSRQNHDSMAQELLPYRKQMMKYRAALDRAKAMGDSPDQQMAAAKLDQAERRLQFLMKYVMASKGELNDEAKAVLQEEMGEMAGIAGEIGKLPFMQRMFGPKPEVQATSPAQTTGQTPTKPGQPPKQARPTHSFEGAPSGENVGDVLNDSTGKPVAKWDGKQWQKLTQ